MRRDVYQAIADPTRRQIIGMLVNNPLNLKTVTENFDVSRPTISKHIKVLTECGVVVIKQQGRERYCYANREKLNEVKQWLAHLDGMWDNKLNALKNFIENGE